MERLSLSIYNEFGVLCAFLCTIFLRHIGASTTIWRLSKALKEGGSQFCLAIVVNSKVVWSSPDLHLNCSILFVVSAAGPYRAIDSSFHRTAWSFNFVLKVYCLIL
ncbi:hypothetical protein MTR67_001924 [Solanum verrucosum]|uniref:Uncharacterized protein n=1 Tax=Solanum verrucosum TaxID=315347 RepID=A0AAF0PV76_SOLVR|nr:hypothetical protein MTR67_001924 [Solanum verrucosum]